MLYQTELYLLVGVTGVEPAACCPPDNRSPKLSYTPKSESLLAVTPLPRYRDAQKVSGWGRGQESNLLSAGYEPTMETVSPPRQVGEAGFEPATCRLGNDRSFRLSYSPW